jgi:hypothetical protein
MLPIPAHRSPLRRSLSSIYIQIKFNRLIYINVVILSGAYRGLIAGGEVEVPVLSEAEGTCGCLFYAVILSGAARGLIAGGKVEGPR